MSSACLMNAFISIKWFYVLSTGFNITGTADTPRFNVSGNQCKCVTVLILLNLPRHCLCNRSTWEYRHFWLYRCNLTYIPRNSLPECGRFVLKLLYTNVSWLQSLDKSIGVIDLNRAHTSPSVCTATDTATYALFTPGTSGTSHIFRKSELGMHADVYARVSSKNSNVSTLKHGHPQNDGSASCVIAHQ